ncbi:MAG: site-specific integrase, partial [Firmicutes bacterium]|nr:site-specific integrase [Bacillota bacterium]
MKGKVITEEQLRAFMRALQEEERSEATISKYLRDVRAFALFLENGGEQVALSKDEVLAYKRALISRGYRVSSINSMLAALDKFFRFLERPDLIVHRLKMQRRVYCPPEKELSKEDYERLVRTAEEKGKRR